MDKLISRQAVIDTVHKTIYQFFDVCEDEEEVPMSDKDKLLLKINKAICNNLKALEQEQSGDLISRQAVLETLDDMDNVLDEDRTIENYKELLKECYEVLPSVKPQEPKYCDRNICLRNEYNGIGCDECEVMKSQEPTDENLHREREQAYMQGYEDASKSFRQEPCEDAISRQAALASIKNLYPDMPVVDIFNARRKWLEKYAPYFECENAVEQLPPVNPQQKTGHWLYYGRLLKCSNCGYIHDDILDDCPNCRAKMD